MQFSDWLIVVPARLASSRLPEKPLVDLGGKPLVVRVVENLAPLADEGVDILIATDAEKIRKVCSEFGLNAVMTKDTHESGTDRCREAASHSKRPFIMNVQCDEPFLDLDDLRGLAKVFAADRTASIGTLVYKCDDRVRFESPNAVKCVRAKNGRGLYFSRSAVPFDRDQRASQSTFWLHIGIYCFRREALDQFCSLGPSPLERLEKLEQLRALENGMTILTHEARQMPIGIDTQADLEAARARLNQ